MVKIGTPEDILAVGIELDGFALYGDYRLLQTRCARGSVDSRHRAYLLFLAAMEFCRTDSIRRTSKVKCRETPKVRSRAPCKARRIEVTILRHFSVMNGAAPSD